MACNYEVTRRGGEKGKSRDVSSRRCYSVTVSVYSVHYTCQAISPGIQNQVAPWFCNEGFCNVDF